MNAISEYSTIRTLPLALILAGLISCEGKKVAGDKENSAHYRGPTAREVFDLRSKCATLGEKILADNMIGPALTQEQVTHYNPQTNRCYVKLEVSSADPTTPRDKFIWSRNLFDGQTGQMLVRASAKGNGKSAYIFEGLEGARPDLIGGLFNYDDAVTLIDKYMADDRKQ